MIEVTLDIDHIKFIKMRKWCVDSLSYDYQFYCYPPKMALGKPARFVFYNHEAEMLFAMRYNDGQNNYKATRQE
jgi:hypothetical protein